MAMDVEQLKKLMRERGESQVGLARLIGITPDKLSKTLGGKRNLKLEEANILRRYFGLDNAAPGKKTHMLPIVGLVSAGAWREGFEHVRGHMPSPDPALSRDSFVVIVEGDSMDRVVGEGEAVVVDPRQRELLPKRYYVVRNASGETTFKQYLDQPGRLEPCSHNPEHKTIFPGQEEFTIVGRVMKAVRDL
ncbi:LexA family protein [Sphingomonas parva]|nr:XRE family transcriptional regulator [Sphingomonas parva]